MNEWGNEIGYLKRIIDPQDIFGYTNFEKKVFEEDSQKIRDKIGKLV